MLQRVFPSFQKKILWFDQVFTMFTAKIKTNTFIFFWISSALFFYLSILVGTHNPRLVIVFFFWLILITLLCNFQQQKVIMEWTHIFFFHVLILNFNFHFDGEREREKKTFSFNENNNKVSRFPYVNVSLYLWEWSKFWWP